MSKTKMKPKKERKPRTRFAYNKEHLKTAVEEVLQGACVAEIARKYSVPESTLRDKKNFRFPEKSPGAATVLTADEEDNLANWISTCQARSIPLTKEQILETVHLVCDLDKRKTTFVNNRPGRKWFDGFRKRHPELFEIIDENKSVKKVQVSENVLRGWFAEITKFLGKENLLSLGANRIFTFDEIRVPLKPKSPVGPQKSAEKGKKNENVTVLFAANAEGTFAPPLLHFVGKALPTDALRTAPENFSFGFSETGSLSPKNFLEYVTEVFQPWLESSGIELPILLFLDGQSPHVTLPLGQFCERNQIQLVGLFPNATQILQPFQAFFSQPFHVSWRKSVHKFCKTNEIDYIKKAQVSLVVEEILKSEKLSEILETGFKKCGLHPLNVDAINFKKAFKKVVPPSSESDSEEEAEAEVEAEMEMQMEMQMKMQMKMEMPIEMEMEAEAEAETSSSADVNQNGEILKTLESVIDKKILEVFRSNTSANWTGPVEDTSLFRIWYSLKTSN